MVAMAGSLTRAATAHHLSSNALFTLAVCAQQTNSALVQGLSFFALRPKSNKICEPHSRLVIAHEPAQDPLSEHDRQERNGEPAALLERNCPPH